MQHDTIAPQIGEMTFDEYIGGKVYIPSNYNPSVPHRLMLAFHPLNTSRWNGKSWCDTLKTFAEINGLILVSPDGGIDGMIDDPIDTAFTSALLDTINVKYNINQQKIYVMGFSWGGKTAYTYGLFHANKIKGFIPIGAAITGVTEVTGLLQNATGKPFYLVHGSLDSPTTRFYPIRDSLNNRGAIVNYKYMQGIGHTIDFPNRNQILSVAFQWIDSVNCANMTTGIENNIQQEPFVLTIFPNLLKQGEIINGVFKSNIGSEASYNVYDISGKIISENKLVVVVGDNYFNIETSKFSAGNYLIKFTSGKKESIEKIFIVK